MAFAAFHLDAERRLLYVSQRARAMLAEGRLLREEGGRLAAALPADAACLAEALAQATRLQASAPVRLGGRPRPLSLGCAVPLGEGEAALVLAALDEEGGPAAAMAAAWFGLTPTEARLAGLLARGKDLQNAGEQLRISLGTARTHLKSIFLKTGASRQSELVRLLNLLPVTTTG
jgi:DNA-binding CsgD family transcriptional regulator